MAVARRALLVALLLCGVAAGPAQAFTCPPRHPRVRVPVLDPDPMLITHLGVDALHAETGLRRHGSQQHLGLTTSSVEWHSDIDARYAEGGGGACAVVAGLVLTLVQAEHTTRIATEIPPDGCLYRAVAAHEDRHVAVNRQTLRQAARQARAAALAWARRAEVRALTVEEALAQLQQGLRRAITPVLQEMEAAREARHRAIDSQAEYRRLSRLCPEDLQVLRARLREPG